MEQGKAKIDINTVLKRLPSFDEIQAPRKSKLSVAFSFLCHPVSFIEEKKRHNHIAKISDRALKHAIDTPEV